MKKGEEFIFRPISQGARIMFSEYCDTVVKIIGFKTKEFDFLVEAKDGLRIFVFKEELKSL